MPRPKFWDTETQKVCAFNFAKRHALDYGNQDVKLSLRAMLRSKKGNQPVTLPPEVTTIHKKAKPGSKPLINTLNNAFKTNKGGISTKTSMTDKYPITHKKWQSDYISWYEHFILPTYGKNAFPLGALHKEWGNEIESDDFVLMLKPRDHYKTSICSIGYAVYNLVERNLFPVLIVSKSEMGTKETYDAIREHLEKNERILNYYGYIIDENRALTSKMLFTQYQPVGMRDPALYCGTFGSRVVMGTHPLLAILDDIEVEPLTTSLMNQAKRLLDKSLISGLPVGARLLLVGTIKGWDHTNDIYLYAEKKGIFSVYRDPAVYKIDAITKQPILDEKGNKIYGMPDSSDVNWYKKKVPALDPHTKRPMLKPDGTPKLVSKIIVDVKTTEVEGTILDSVQADILCYDVEDHWRSIYPERYRVKDIIRKRIATREVDKESDDTFWSEFFLEARDPKGNFFSKDRIGFMPPPNFATLQTFVEYIRTRHWPVFLWVDPGGKGGHGIAIAVACIRDDNFYVLDMTTSRAGIPITAKVIGDLILKWHVTVWGCEGNYSQKETFGDQLQLHLKEYFRKIGKSHKFIINSGRNNTGDKILRIQTHLTAAMGMVGTPKKFFVNQTSGGYDMFEKEIARFPFSPNPKNEFDILDCIASIRIHLSQIGQKVMCITR